MISFRNSLCYPKPAGSSDHSAGNILRKTVNGKTTVYTYDDANQLMTSTKDGKVTTYKYDAAGRMIQEGAKTYRYGYLDKILNVDENGENVASFTYHMDGQIASAKTKSGTESFLWDGLALIGRDKTQYINEPYVTGGNPILANDKVLFNDILGTTLGVNSDKYAAIPRDAFGMTAQSGKDEFFTGKPYIGELGYAFLFRNYRAEQGKWQTSDPLGYPDGWNNLAYVNNRVIVAIDFMGGNIYYLGADDAVGGIGHAAVIVGNEVDGYKYGSFGSGTLFSGEYLYRKDLSSLIKEINKQRQANDRAPYNTTALMWNTSSTEDALASLYIATHLNDTWIPYVYDCLDFAEGVFSAAGCDFVHTVDPSTFYNTNYYNLNCAKVVLE